jgi:hypothetical protein
MEMVEGRNADQNIQRTRPRIIYHYFHVVLREMMALEDEREEEEELGALYSPNFFFVP